MARTPAYLPEQRCRQLFGLKRAHQARSKFCLAMPILVQPRPFCLGYFRLLTGDIFTNPVGLPLQGTCIEHCARFSNTPLHKVKFKLLVNNGFAINADVMQGKHMSPPLAGQTC